MRRDGCIVVHLLPQTSDFFCVYDIKIAQEGLGFDVFVLRFAVKRDNCFNLRTVQDNDLLFTKIS